MINQLHITRQASALRSWGLSTYLLVFQSDLITNRFSNFVNSFIWYSFRNCHGWDPTRLCADDKTLPSTSLFDEAIEDKLRNLSCLATSNKKYRFRFNSSLRVRLFIRQYCDIKIFVSSWYEVSTINSLPNSQALYCGWDLSVSVACTMVFNLLNLLLLSSIKIINEVLLKDQLQCPMIVIRF